MEYLLNLDTFVHISSLICSIRVHSWIAGYIYPPTVHYNGTAGALQPILKTEVLVYLVLDGPIIDGSKYKHLYLVKVH